jgi:hypothetical protein
VSYLGLRQEILNIQLFRPSFTEWMTPSVTFIPIDTVSSIWACTMASRSDFMSVSLTAVSWSLVFKRSEISGWSCSKSFRRTRFIIDGQVLMRPSSVGSGYFWSSSTDNVGNRSHAAWARSSKLLVT